MLCPHCGAPVTALLYRCGQCGAVLPPADGAAPVVPVNWAPAPEPPSGRILSLDGWGLAAMSLIWFTTAVLIVGLAPLVRAMSVDTTTAADLTYPASQVTIDLLAFGFLQLVTWGVFITWLLRARLNLNRFPEAAPKWGEPWVVTAWFVPLVGAFIGASVIGDIARNSVDGYAQTVGRRYANKAKWWLCFLIFAGVAPISGISYTFITGFVGFRLGGHLFLTAIGAGLFACAFWSVAAATRMTGLIGWVNAEHRQRVERRWDGGYGARAAAGFDADILG